MRKYVIRIMVQRKPYFHPDTRGVCLCYSTKLTVSRNPKSTKGKTKTNEPESSIGEYGSPLWCLAYSSVWKWRSRDADNYVGTEVNHTRKSIMLYKSSMSNQKICRCPGDKTSVDALRSVYLWWCRRSWWPYSYVWSGSTSGEDLCLCLY